MASLFRRKQTPSIKEEWKANIALFNAHGRDTSLVAMKLAETYYKENKKKALLLEYPCLGIPKLTLHHPHERAAEINMDKLLLDYDRGQYTRVYDYIIEGEQLDFIPINPKNKPESPVLLKLEDEQKLIKLPLKLQGELHTDYHLTISLTQGQLFHHMTFFNLRYADFIVMTIEDDAELIWSYAIYQKLIKEFGLPAERVILYCDHIIPDFKEAPIITKISHIFEQVRRVSE